jgi:Fungal chitosanase of glycosyl hydrolase group 75
MSVAPIEVVANIGKSVVYRLGLGIFYESKLAIDADGSPHCYHPISERGLDDLVCAGRPGHWWGIATNTDHIDGMEGKGTPYIQTDMDPAPGFYISKTAHADGTKKVSDPHRYVDAEKVPFIVLPGSPYLGAHVGALAMVFHPATGDSSAAIFADVGPDHEIGEGSVALAKNLSINPDPRHGGVPWGVVTLVFTHTHRNWPVDVDDIVNTSDKNFLLWGGFNRLRAALPEIDWSKYA